MDGLTLYERRLVHYCSFSRVEIADPKNLASLKEEQIKEREGQLILSKIFPSDYVILLDSRGDSLTSEEFAQRLDNLGMRSIKKLIFVVGGAYGFSEKMYQRADSTLSLSAMTFSHQMIRLLFTEQLYRAFTILKGEPYHHK